MWNQASRLITASPPNMYTATGTDTPVHSSTLVAAK